MNTTVPFAERLSGVHTATELRVADYFMTAGAAAAAMSAREIAGAVGTSDATVLRTTKSLGFSSLRELRRALGEEGREPDISSRVRATIDRGDRPHDVLASAIERHVQALTAMPGRITGEDFDAAVDVVNHADRVWWCGTGPSSHLAEYGAFLGRRLGIASGSLIHSGPDLADELLEVRSGHCVIVLAYGRIHSHVRALLQRSAEMGASVVLITDTLGQDGTLPVTVRLYAGRGVPNLFASHGVTVVLIEALVLAVAAQNNQRTVASLSSLNELRRSIAGKRLDVDPR